MRRKDLIKLVNSLVGLELGWTDQEGPCISTISCFISEHVKLNSEIRIRASSFVSLLPVCVNDPKQRFTTAVAEC
jgi:hypothetical protein